jgi:hypothetical protein
MPETDTLTPDDGSLAILVVVILLCEIILLG